MNGDLAEVFKERFYAAANITDATLSNWLETHGIGKGVAQTIGKRGGIPSAEKLVAISMATGKAVDWLLGVDDTHLGEIERIKQADGDATTEFVYIPRYNVDASSGAEQWIDNREKAAFTMAFRRYWVEKHLNANPRDLSVISINGDSMAPLLQERDNILINHALTAINDGIYVLRVDKQVLVKRTQRLSKDKLLLISENPAYKPIEWDFGNADQTDWAIIGRVVWCGRQM
ncbi:helix-turn-helix transcriptional regulator [Ralstonia solanacearum]|uniref:S24 family peptidase n=1 Tax=Ralstonia solanacearum TaxID=305 RepID=UPI0006966EFF|nr:S24 family peptidase [Ralstonia solanacearum]